MSFWTLSDGEEATEPGKRYEVPGGGNFDPIPDGSSVLAMIDEAKWAENKDGDEFLSLRWSILEPEEYAKRKIFQKLWVTDADPSVKDEAKAKAKRDKAKRMLAAIDANAGGKLARSEGRPTDDKLATCLCEKPMVITLRVWEIDNPGDPRGSASGNWVSAVAPKSAEVAVKDAAPKKAKAQTRDELEDEIPF
jgi:hypothetical protein